MGGCHWAKILAIDSPKLKIQGMTMEDGTRQDMAAEIRFQYQKLLEGFGEILRKRFKNTDALSLTKEELEDLQSVVSSFREDNFEGWTDKEIEETRHEFFLAVRKLRPVFLKLLGIRGFEYQGQETSAEEQAEWRIEDLIGEGEIPEIEPLDAFLLAAYRFTVGDF